MVSSASVTGAQSSFGNTQEAYFRRIAAMQLQTPLVVGFGISNAETFRAATRFSRGAIIGSAFIQFLEKKGVTSIPDFIKKIR
jgi:tryptophan synthase alpha chain